MIKLLNEVCFDYALKSSHQNFIHYTVTPPISIVQEFLTVCMVMNVLNLPVLRGTVQLSTLDEFLLTLALSSCQGNFFLYGNL